jgi:hypothetical protein
MPARLRLQVNPGRQGTDGTLTLAIPSADDIDGVAVVETTLVAGPAAACMWLDAVFTWARWRQDGVWARRPGG